MKGEYRIPRPKPLPHPQYVIILESGEDTQLKHELDRLANAQGCNYPTLMRLRAFLLSGDFKSVEVDPEP